MTNGFLLIDKQKGINSFKLVIALRKIANQKRVGFAGTLDPLASGLMILAFGEYTKLLPYLEAADKVYLAKLKLGFVSNTYDGEGEIVEQDISSLEKPNLQMLNKIIVQNFLGKIKQIPPKFSAIQIDGKRAYDLARKGTDFSLKPREVEIFSCEVVSYNFPDLELKIHCSSGTYIRSIANDLGVLLKFGAYLTDLRRINVAGVGVDQAEQLEEINAENFRLKFADLSLLFPTLPQFDLVKSQYEILAKGNFIDNVFDFSVGIALGLLDEQVVGLIETCENGRKLKFKKKFNIF